MTDPFASGRLKDLEVFGDPRAATSYNISQRVFMREVHVKQGEGEGKTKAGVH